jgi:hypothetical protein
MLISHKDAYDLFAVNMVTSMLGVVFWQNAAHSPGKIPSQADTAIKVSTSTGTVIGQVGFGKWLLDTLSDHATKSMKVSWPISWVGRRCTVSR